MFVTARHYYSLLEELRKELDILAVEEVLPGDEEEILEEYWIVENFAKVQIRMNSRNLRKRYFLIEPQISREEAKLLHVIYEDVRRKLIYSDEENLFDSLIKALKKVLSDYSIKVEDELYVKMLYYFVRDFLGVGAVEPILNDENVEDISCDGYDIPVFVYHRKYGNMPTNLTFSKEELDSYVLSLAQKANKHLSYANPIVDATLPDGSRIQITYGSEISTRGSTFTIRKFRSDPFTPIDLINLGTLSSKITAYFWLLVENKRSFMVIGETASGKTTTLNALLMFIPPDSKVVSIEDTREIQLYHDNWIPEVTRISVEGTEIDMYDLLKAALRQRPDYIVVGEVRGREAQTLFQAMATGHASYATFHAGDVNQLIYRLEEDPLNVPRVLIQFLDAVIVQSLWVKRNEKKRRAKEIFEIIGLDPTTKELIINPIYRWEPSLDRFTEISVPKTLEKIAESSGLTMGEIFEEIEERKTFLEMMREKGIRYYKDVSRLIALYYSNPEVAFEELRGST
ncbi:type II secretion system protein E [Ferroglobus placidus DSM 10642]|uniref:Type II secretion system protein E n=1 Tax=Ferroglobus placidus (strain DSM 10642 / AEDII12DO) TaxID=589924 RepID=D3RYL9_FERPA|nr:type II/IV secretion system ATPase subunit [Ferroglobus placidus]ADC65582.1 type II secretion system protein E [Ferroglobus placidus DSM 10642]